MEGIFLGALLALTLGGGGSRGSGFRGLWEEQPKSGILHSTIKTLLEEELGFEIDFQVFMDTSRHAKEKHYLEYLYNAEFLRSCLHLMIEGLKDEIPEILQNPDFDLCIPSKVIIGGYFQIRVEIDCRKVEGVNK